MSQEQGDSGRSGSKYNDDSLIVRATGRTNNEISIENASAARLVANIVLSVFPHL